MPLSMPVQCGESLGVGLLEDVHEEHRRADGENLVVARQSHLLDDQARFCHARVVGHLTLVIELNVCPLRSPSTRRPPEPGSSGLAEHHADVATVDGAALASQPAPEDAGGSIRGIVRDSAAPLPGPWTPTFIRRGEIPGAAEVGGARMASATAHAALTATYLILVPPSPTSLVFPDGSDVSCSCSGCLAGPLAVRRIGG